MNKSQLDDYYHLLRELCISDDIVQKEAVAGITSHLTGTGGDYNGLLRFSSFYITKYILSGAIELIGKSLGPKLEFSRVVELGAGFCALGRGIAEACGHLPALFVDKRHWTLIDIVADIETKNGVKRVLDEMRNGDFVVMSELLHCLDDPKKTLEPFREWPMLVVEYKPLRDDYKLSYNTQIKKFGCQPVGDIHDVFPNMEIIQGSTYTHGIWLVLPR